MYTYTCIHNYLSRSERHFAFIKREPESGAAVVSKGWSIKISLHDKFQTRKLLSRTQLCHSVTISFNKTAASDWGSRLRQTAWHCDTLQRTATHCNAHSIHCNKLNTLQHAATRCQQKSIETHCHSITVCCSVLQCVLQCVAVCVAVCAVERNKKLATNLSQCVAVRCGVSQCVLQCVLQKESRGALLMQQAQHKHTPFCVYYL